MSISVVSLGATCSSASELLWALRLCEALMILPASTNQIPLSEKKKETQGGKKVRVDSKASL